jgi:hypothetical protein
MEKENHPVLERYDPSTLQFNDTAGVINIPTLAILEEAMETTATACDSNCSFDSSFCSSRASTCGYFKTGYFDARIHDYDKNDAAAEAVATTDSELVSKQIRCNGLPDSLPTFIDSIEPTCSGFGACDISSNVADAFQRTAYSSANVALLPTTSGAASTTKADDITSHEKSVSILLI